MNQDIYEKIKSVFELNNGYANTSEISNMGFNRYYISKLKHDGIIIPVKVGLYKWVNHDFDYNFELVEVFKIVPEGVLCLKSALSYHGLSSIYHPTQYEVAIERSHKISIPKCPPIKIIFLSQLMYELGRTDIKIAGHGISVYDMEKTICDCIRYRNKVGIEIIKESIKEYLKRNDRNLDKLMEYAEQSKIQRIVKEYLELLE